MAIVLDKKPGKLRNPSSRLYLAAGFSVVGIKQTEVFRKFSVQRWLRSLKLRAWPFKVSH